MLKLYDTTLSGNCYKIRLLLAQLGIPYERIAVKLLHEGPRPEELLEKNPNGRVPVVVLDDGRVLAESNAILWHLADGTPLLPDDAYERARVLQWLFFEQNGPEPDIGITRFWVAIVGQPERYPEMFDQRRKGAHRALGVMNRHLSDGREFFVGDYGIADLALYAYTHVAPEAGVELEPYPEVRAWMRRVESRPGWVSLQGD